MKNRKLFVFLGLLVFGLLIWFVYFNRPGGGMETETVSLLARATPSPTRSRETATVIPPLTPSPTLTASATVGVTVTLPPTVPPPFTATPGGNLHDPTQWHLPSLEPGFRHHHGVNPRAYIEIFGAPLEHFLDTYGEISYPWHTPDENSVYGFGHHNAYVWLYDQAEPGKCALFNNGGQIPTDDLNCVTDVLMQLHTDGTQAHLRKRFHSHFVFVKVCNQLPGGGAGDTCQIYGTGGWVDYGILETPYKQTYCPLVTDPVYFQTTPPDLNQPPYRTSHTAYRGDTSLLTDPAYLLWDELSKAALDKLPMVVEFWSGLRPNAIQEKAYDLGNGKGYPDNMPNAGVGVAWSSLDAWGIVNPVSCADPELDVLFDATGHSALNNSAFQIFTVWLYNPPQAPDSGYAVYFTDRWGHEVNGCTLETVGLEPDCIPYYVTAGPLSGPALFNRPVQQGDPNVAPILEFDVPGGGVILPAPNVPPFFPVP